MAEGLYTVSYEVTTIKKYECSLCCRQLFSKVEVESHIKNEHQLEKQSIHVKEDNGVLEEYQEQLTDENDSFEENLDDHVQHALTNIEKLTQRVITQEYDSNDSNNDVTSHLQIELKTEIAGEVEVQTSDIKSLRPSVAGKLLLLKPQEYECELCQNKYAQKYLLKMHMKEHECNMNFCCDLCNKTFFSKQQLICHKKVHMLEKKFKCLMCDKSYKFKQQLNLHILTHSGMKPFSCETCQKCFTLERQLQSHLKVHTLVKPFICSQCGKSFKIKQQLQNHELTHYDIKPFMCEICTKTFKLKQQLQNHQKVHEDIKPYNCITCGKAFKFKQQLQNHGKIHIGIKQFICEFCQKEFMFKQQLQIHMKIHFGIKEFCCHICTKDFRTKQQLQKHLEMHERRSSRLSGKQDDSMSDISTLSSTENGSEFDIERQNPALVNSSGISNINVICGEGNIVDIPLKSEINNCSIMLPEHCYGKTVIQNKHILYTDRLDEGQVGQFITKDHVKIDQECNIAAGFLSHNRNKEVCNKSYVSEVTLNDADNTLDGCIEISTEESVNNLEHNVGDTIVSKHIHTKNDNLNES